MYCFTFMFLRLFILHQLGSSFYSEVQFTELITFYTFNVTYIVFYVMTSLEVKIKIHPL